jgi:flavin-dependent dehydrogenase
LPALLITIKPKRPVDGDHLYDVAIIGGGLGGLALSIQLARLGYDVIVFEKEKYPFHKVCGEYMSLESWDFLNTLGIDPDGMNVPIITRVMVSSANGKSFTRHLPLGGFGISRYRLDAALAELALHAGVQLLENTKVNDVVYDKELDIFKIDISQQSVRAKLACGSWGKRSNVDVKWKRNFSMAGKNKLNNYIGVKYHVSSGLPADTIALHNFKNGYCGIVKIEDDKYNLCYLTTAENLQRSKGDLKKMERDILSQNPFLENIFRSARFSEPAYTISQISFDKKSLVENHVIMVGDAAGMITPLCGNGMSMALHASKIATTHIHHFLQGNINRDKMENRYQFQWKKQFKARLRRGRRLQRIFGASWIGNLFVSVMKPFPGLLDRLIRGTHGKPF